jgi:Cu(I)/Ag(I) efflux system periplasmic protein CusF
MRSRFSMSAATALTALSLAVASAADFTTGRVVEVDQAARTVTLEHEDIENLGMPGMTMTFRVGADVDITKLKPGGAIEFTADSVDDEFTVTQVK